MLSVSQTFLHFILHFKIFKSLQNLVPKYSCFHQSGHLNSPLGLSPPLGLSLTFSSVISQALKKKRILKLKRFKLLDVLRFRLGRSNRFSGRVLQTREQLVGIIAS